MKIRLACCRVLMLLLATGSIASAAPAQRSPGDPSGGIFFYAKEGHDTNTAPIANPDVLGNWVQFYWSEIEQQEGNYDWSLIESRMKPWVEAGKKVAFRVYWVGSGYWRHPAARTATPASVWEDGAKFVQHADSGTEIPLIWDPIYKRRALAFLAALAQRYDDNTNVLFFDVTPGAETNPYRFVAFNQRTPEFKEQYAATPASDGRKYSDQLWLATVREFIDSVDKIFEHLPLVVTLNVGTLNLGDAHNDYSVEIGQYAVDRGFYVGQNGLHGASYLEDSERKAAFLQWSQQTRLVFETLGEAGTVTAYNRKPLGSLREIVDAANRVNAHYLLPYPVDVLKGTKGQPNYDPEFASALTHGARTLGKGDTTADQPVAADPAAPLQVVAQPAAEENNAPRGSGEGDTQPSWLMPLVEGPNLFYKEFDSKTVGQNVSYLLYLPPGYETSAERRYPVVYWLHGIGGSQQGLPRLTARMTEAINAGKTPPLIMVFVNGMIRSSYVDSADGKTPVETVSIKELIPHVDATYRTIPRREGRMIEGFSMGGGGAAKWGFKHPELFGSISIIDGALHKPGDPAAGRLAESFQTLYGGNREYFAASNPWNLAEKNANAVKDRTLVRIVTRTAGLGGLNREFSEFLTRLGVTHELHAVPDAPHSPGPLYEGLGDTNWGFYQRAFAGVIPNGGAAESAPARSAASPAPAPSTPHAARDVLQGFQRNGERWTYRDGDFTISGILLKPEGKGPFPAVLISHGLGGSAETFGMSKAREMVKWGFVCIAPDYTHSAKYLGDQRPDRGKGARPGGRPKGAGQGGVGGPRASAQYGTYGASEENIQRARTCIELLSSMPEVDARQIVGYGHSMGGFVTIGLASASPDLLEAAAISGSGVSPGEGFPAPSAAKADTIRTPFLMLHGSIDPVVRPQQSADFKAILDKNGVPNQRVVYEGEGHPVDQAKREEVFAAIKDWFAKYGAISTPSVSCE